MSIAIAFRLCCENRLSEKYVYCENINKIQIELSTKASDVFQQRKNSKIKVKAPPLYATKALRAGRGITLPNLRPRH